MRTLVRRLAVPLTLALATGALVVGTIRGLVLVSGPLSAHAFGVDWVISAPGWLGLLLTAPALLYALGRSLADLPWQQKWLSLLFRLGVVVCLALSLARASRTTRTDRIATVHLVDVSDSVSDDALEDTAAALRAARAARRSGDVDRLVTFARRPRVVDWAPDGASNLSRPRREGDPDAGAGTDLQAALRLAYGLFPPGYLRRAVLYSDGLETEGDLASEASRARPLGVKLFVVPSRRPPPSEFAVVNVAVPQTIKVGETFEVVAEVYASRGGPARVELFQNGALNGLDRVRDLDLPAGTSLLRFRSVVRVAGEVSYKVELSPGAGDTFPANNRYTVSVDVPGRSTVLYVEADLAHATPLASALEKQGFDVDLRAPRAFPGSSRELDRYDFVVLSDTPAADIHTSADELLDRYVRDGGGFLFAGGPNGYGPGGWSHRPMERLLPVRMDSDRQKDTPTVAMSLVIDRSGSMTGLPLEMAKQAARATVDTLAPDDLLEVIAFDSVPTRYVKLQPARNRSRIESDIGRIQAGGGTEIFAALDAAYQDLSVAQARKKHVILLTDGRAPSGGIRDLVQAMTAESITVTTVGLGNEVDDQLLSMIKDYGGGRYHKVPDPSSLPKIFTREAEMIAKSAASNDYFPVRQVTRVDCLRGIDVGAAPLLGGYTSTQSKPPPAQVILEHGDAGEPVLARWHVGLGYALAWTSDVKARWAADWVRWPSWPVFWGQVVHEHMRQRRKNEIELTTEVAAGEVRASIDAFTNDDRFDDGLVSTLSVQGPDPSKSPSAVPMPQTAPGHYEARFALGEFGPYLLHAQHRRLTEGGALALVATSSGHVSNPYPAEYARIEPNVALLEAIATETGGRADPAPATLFDPEGEHVTSKEELWPRLVGAAIVLLLLDLLMRRVRFFDRAFSVRARAA